MPLTLSEQFGAIDATTQFTRLSALDRIWTDYLNTAKPPIPEEDVRMLARLSEIMAGLLDRAPDLAGYLNSIVNSHAEELENEYLRVIRGDDLTEQTRVRVASAVERHGYILDAVNGATQFVRDNAHFEKQALEAKIATIEGGGFSLGDLTPNFLCNLGLTLIGGGIFAPFPLNIVGISAGAAVIIGVERSGNEC
jgi:hypothetical protein